MLKSLVILVCALVYTSMGHLCVISPPQRGSMTGLNKPASPDCRLTVPPCGGRDNRTIGVTLKAGQVFTVTLQKNLDHFYKENPGHFSISMGTRNTTMKELVQIKDDPNPALTLYTLNVTMPNQHGKMIFRVQYVTQNPTASPAYYQCSDIYLRK